METNITIIYKRRTQTKQTIKQIDKYLQQHSENIEQQQIVSLGATTLTPKKVNHKGNCNNIMRT